MIKRYLMNDEQQSANYKKNRRLAGLAIFFLLDLIVLGFIFSQYQPKTTVKSSPPAVVRSHDMNDMNGKQGMHSKPSSPDSTNQPANVQPTPGSNTSTTLTNTGPANVWIVFVGASLLGTAMHYWYTLRKNKSISD